MTKLIEGLAHEGIYKITKRYKDGTIKTEVHNAITSVGINRIARILLGENPDLEVKFLAVGNGGKVLDNADTLLDNEIFRTPFQFRTQTANNEITTEFSIQDFEAVGTWRELGIFVGSTASQTANTGVMLSRVLYLDDKTALEEINIQYISRFLRV